ncbi:MULTISPECIES: helix-turn-helix transcriptional regulator [Streptomycetaceae]|uniref:ATPase-like protein n=1 Tax=Streptantibioticus cattleyicolor (strain ATCC 35852 / DSM 46488 / JCM 4925 / NBRC 14057 / NRRL 8057) TaxID=1003195 RepID=F8K315_STREN|nr:MULTISPECIES: AAA family ATPase [Streptomycetaceae]AEW92503.1 ATPase-like protein [Streptantibioticus cattleyicolor NRRL 8057 = DSM 46488]MYS57305.1 AAA family ATPase [Streptomyces sp. SID5468]CCB72864.1 putative Transcriptional regulator, luxR family [Streptantibioticus cattleyicolor NRRL 8057 = DSM 46488]
MIERESELAELAAAFAESAAGGVRVVVLKGVVGTGKTALMEEFGGRARGAGARLLRASGAPTESSLSLGIVRQLLAGEVFDRDRAVVVRGLLDHQLLADAACDGVSRSRVLDGLATAVLELAEQSPVVIAIDDTQYLDAFSQDWLIYLIRRAGLARILIVLGWRDDDIEMSPSNSRLLCAELYQHAYLRLLLLAPLSSSGVAELMTERLPQSVSTELAAEAHQLTGGNLLLLHALLEDSWAAIRGDGPPTELNTGPEFERAVQLVLRRCDPVTLRVAGAISVIGEPSRFAFLDRLVGVASDRVAAATQILTRTGLVEAGRMRHPIMAGAVLNAFSATERSELSRRAADLLKACGADSLTIAEHFVASGRLDDPSAVLNLVEGAQQALEEGHSRRATELLRLAYQVDTDGRRRVEILALLLRAGWRDDLRASVGHLSELTEAMLSGRLRGRHATMPIIMLLIQGRVEDACSVLSRLAADVPPGSRPSWEFEMVRMWLANIYPGIFRRVAGESRTNGTPIMPPGAIGYRLLEHFQSSHHQGAPAERLVQADEALWQQPLTEINLLPLILALHTMMYAERLEEAEQRCRELTQTCLDLQAPTWRALFCAIAADIALRRGSLGVAASRAAAALELVPVAEWGVMAAEPLSTLLTAQTLQGKHDEAARTLALRVPDVMFETPFGLSYLLARGRHYVERGLAQVALDDFQAVADLLDQWGVAQTETLPWRTEMAAAHLQLGDHETAARYAREQLRRIGTDSHLRVRGRTMRLLAATRELHLRPPLLCEAVDVLHRSGDKFELATALAALRDTYTQLGDAGRARSVARKTNSIRQACFAEQPARRVDAPDVLEETEVDMLALSDAERRVAKFAAKGLTNREIASKLYLTTSTVEQHLTRIYRKLGVSSRVQLLSRLGPQPTPSHPALENASA